MRRTKYTISVMGLLAAAPLLHGWDMRVVGDNEITYADLLDQARLAPDQQLSDRLVTLAVTLMRTHEPEMANLLVVKPFAELARTKSSVMPALLLQSFKPHYPYLAGVLIAIFLEADMHEQALRALHMLVQCDWPVVPTTDVVIAGVMTQLAQVAVLNSERAEAAAALFMASPYNFCDKIYGYGGVLHLFVLFAQGLGTVDMPETVAPGMIAFAKVLIKKIKDTKPDLCTIKDDGGLTARERLHQASESNVAKRPVVARVQQVLSELL